MNIYITAYIKCLYSVGFTVPFLISLLVPWHAILMYTYFEYHSCLHVQYMLNLVGKGMVIIGKILVPYADFCLDCQWEITFLLGYMLAFYSELFLCLGKTVWIYIHYGNRLNRYSFGTSTNKLLQRIIQ